MLEDMVMKMRKADDKYRDEMFEALKDLDCLRERLIVAIEAVDRFEDGMDKVKFEPVDVPPRRRK